MRGRAPRVQLVVGGPERDVMHRAAALPAALRAILSKMRRGGDPASSLAMIEKMRCIVSDIAIRTTFIVGFPGETEDEFQLTMDLVEQVRFSAVFAFTYSPRPGTPAARSFGT